MISCNNKSKWARNPNIAMKIVWGKLTIVLQDIRSYSLITTVFQEIIKRMRPSWAITKTGKAKMFVFCRVELRWRCWSWEGSLKILGNKCQRWYFGFKIKEHNELPFFCHLSIFLLLFMFQPPYRKHIWIHCWMHGLTFEGLGLVVARSLEVSWNINKFNIFVQRIIDLRS